jgi:hypothetical protein
VEIKARLFRNYPLGETRQRTWWATSAASTRSEKERIEDSDDAANYRGTDYIGKLGVEAELRKDPAARRHRRGSRWKPRPAAAPCAAWAAHPATPGNTVVLSIDIKLQKLVEDLFGDRRGALVALDPKTGEVLAFVSKPTFDPNLFVDGIDQENWQELNESIDKPLLNRALRGTYPPGSTYKPFMALAALETGKRTPQQTIHDPGYFMFGNHRFRDDKEGGHGSVDMYKSIVQSCDTYYYMLANDMGVDLMHDELQKFGFGTLTGIDIHGEMRGLLPSTEWKRTAYKRPEQQKWYAGETISLGIGQGYNNFTMLQLALATSVIANDGVKMKPHLVKAMALMDFIKKQFIDIIQWTEDGDGTLAWRFPMAGMEIQNGGQLVVRESQMAVFVNEGKVADVFGPGTYKLTTQTLPVLTYLKNWDKLFESPFKSDVYFFSTRQQIDQKWGTPQPITIRDKDFGAVRLRAFGNYAFRIADPKLFHTENLGHARGIHRGRPGRPVARPGAAEHQQRHCASGIPFLDLAANQMEFAKALTQLAPRWPSSA